MECQFIPKSSTNMHTTMTESTVVVYYDLHNQSKTVLLHIPPVDPVTSWTVILDFNFLVTGDLSFFATTTGQDGHSHCRCVYCDLTRTQWSNSTHQQGNSLFYLCAIIMLHSTLPVKPRNQQRMTQRE